MIQYAGHQLHGKRQLQSLYLFGTPGASNPLWLPTEPSVGTYQVGKVLEWAKEDPKAVVFEGVISLQLGRLNQHALLEPSSKNMLAKFKTDKITVFFVLTPDSEQPVIFKCDSGWVPFCCNLKRVLARSGVSSISGLY